ncbi:reactive intermediate/imine deaminase [Rhizobium sp. R635]|uniref:Rid family detoxifying hydrolase n=1 Tax=unclassified Rhizobium TaxID=2613769 RepID=UPI000B533908|nr:Rid family detoxifying hydrolase [Rhizobium sp. R635]OWV80487.1 reactive intermediate/imine deaminase [Rhizobium sp. R635]
MQKIDTATAPKAIGPYSQAIAHNGFLFVSGQLPLDPATGNISGETSAEQARQCLDNLRAIAEAAGADMSKVVKTTVLLADLAAFAAVNDVYAGYFSDPFPARACYQVAALPKGALVEIEAVIALE